MHFSTILNNSCLQDVLNSKPRRGAITLSHSDTISHALETLATYQLLSAPIVVYPDVEDNGAGMDVDATPTLIGWLDLRVCLDLDRRAVGIQGRTLTLSLSLRASLGPEGHPEFAPCLRRLEECREEHADDDALAHEQLGEGRRRVSQQTARVGELLRGPQAAPHRRRPTYVVADCYQKLFHRTGRVAPNRTLQCAR